MSTNKPSQKPIKITCVIPLLLLSLGNFSQVQAQTARPKQPAQTAQPVKKPDNRAQKQLSEIDFPDNGEPGGRRRGGTGRGDECPELKMPITALVPGENANNKSFLASTVAEYPTFLVYLPELPKDVRSGEFVLQDQESNDILRTRITLPGKPGVIAISLPRNPKYALKQNSMSHWYFNIYCSAAANKPGSFVDAWVRRVALTPELQQQLNSAKPREYKVYAANKLWYDAVNNLAELRRTNPGDRVLAEDWSKLLKSVGLPEVASSPIVQRYSLEK